MREGKFRLSSISFSTSLDSLNRHHRRSKASAFQIRSLFSALSFWQRSTEVGIDTKSLIWIFCFRAHALLSARFIERTLYWAHALLSARFVSALYFARLIERTFYWARAFLSARLFERTPIWAHALFYWVNAILSARFIERSPFWAQASWAHTFWAQALLSAHFDEYFPKIWKWDFFRNF